MFERFRTAPSQEQLVNQATPTAEPTVSPESGQEQGADRGKEKEGYDPEKFSVAFRGLCAIAAAAAELGKSSLEKRYGATAGVVGNGLLAGAKELLKDPQVLSRMLNTAGKTYQTVERVERLVDDFAFGRFEKDSLVGIESAPDEEAKEALKQKLSRSQGDRVRRLEEAGLKTDIRNQVANAVFSTLLPSRGKK